MNKKALISGVGALILVIFIALYGYFLAVTESKGNTEKVTDKVGIEAEAGLATNSGQDKKKKTISDDLELKESFTEDKTNQTCLQKLLAFTNSPQGERLKRWKQEVGAPYSEVLPNGTIYYPPHPYANYSNESLLIMAESGDVEAMYAYGMNMYWKAFTGKGKSSALEQGYAFPNATDVVDEETYTVAQGWLLEAAFRGRLFVFHDLAFMTGIKLDVLERAGKLSEKEKSKLQDQVFIFGNAPEELIQGLSKSLFTTDNIPQPHQKQLLDNQMPAFLKEYQKERHTRGLGPFNMSVPPEYKLEQSLCD